MYEIVLSNNAEKDLIKIRNSNLYLSVVKLLDSIINNPTLPPSKKLSGNLKGCYSRRITIKHRLVFTVDEELKIIKILKIWGHY